MEKKKSKKQRKKEERKKIMDKLGSRHFTKEEWDDLMNFYDGGYSNRWFYNDWVKAGRPERS